MRIVYAESQSYGVVTLSILVAYSIADQRIRACQFEGTSSMRLLVACPSASGNVTPASVRSGASSAAAAGICRVVQQPQGTTPRWCIAPPAARSTVSPGAGKYGPSSR